MLVLLSWVATVIACAVHLALVVLLLALQNLKQSGILTASLPGGDQVGHIDTAFALRNLSLGLDSACLGIGDRVQCADLQQLLPEIAKLPRLSDLKPVLDAVQKLNAQTILKVDILLTLLCVAAFVLTWVAARHSRFGTKFGIVLAITLVALAPSVVLLLIFNGAIGAVAHAGLSVQPGVADNLGIGAMVSAVLMVIAPARMILLS
ncbi:hypothetical protein JX265_014095 [Neoarthrinium moseri]|uniref:Uncharacterized protein n=1 Tax=Neoarthrinium moseri TaxID=1658444 RepID=A0A9P9W7E2_9PEZI|nr:hypothetical protein JX265_014095 [Neoarthrinium moseri]